MSEHVFPFLRNLGGGVFTRVDTLPFTTAVGPYTTPSWSDFDGDGDLDGMYYAVVHKCPDIAPGAR